MMTSTELKSSFVLGSVFASRMLGLFMIMPVFSLYAAHLPHVTPTLIGLALGIYGLTQAMFQLPFGLWSDYTHRHYVIYFGLALFAAGSVLAAFSHSIYGIIAGRALQGTGAIGSTIIALVADLTSAENRPKAMAIIGITIGLAFSMAIVLGPVLAHWIGVPGLFILTAVLALLAILLLKVYVPMPQRQHQEFNLAALPQQLKAALLQPNLLRLDFAVFSIHATLTATFVILPMQLVSLYHLPVNEHWYLYLPVFILAALFVGSILRKKLTLKQQIKFSSIGLGLMIINQISQLLTAHGTTFWLLALGLWLFFTGFTLLEAMLPAIVSQLVDPRQRGAATGLFSTFQFLGIFVGGVLGGYLTSRYDAQGVFVATVILLGICYILFWPLRKVTNTTEV